MRSSRTNNTSSSHNIDNHESRSRNVSDYRSSRSNPNANDSNGHTNNANEYRSNKRSNVSSSSTAASGNLIKRMKSSTNNNSDNNKDHVNTNQSSYNKSSSNNNSSSTSSLTINIDQNECHQITYNAYQHEETEAFDVDKDEDLVQKSISDYERFTQTTNNLRKVIKAILEFKQQQLNKNSNSQNGEKNLEKANILSDMKTLGLKHLMEMKYLNRLDKHRLKEARKRICQNKDQVDQIHLQLQNIQYEVIHLQKEQKTCASFKSKDENLDLVDEAKFLVSDHFPEDLKHLLQVVQSEDNSSGSTVQLNRSLASSEELHRLHLARLDWELKQRISSDNRLKMADESRYRLELEISTKKRTLAQFDPTLRNVIESAKPLVTQLNVPLQVYNQSNMLTSYLPQPLYVLYIQLCAYKSAFELNYDVNIIGSAEDVQEYQLKQKHESDNNIFYLLGRKCMDVDQDAIDDVRNLDDDDDDVHLHRSKSKKSRYHSSSHNKSSSSTISMNEALDSGTEDPSSTTTTIPPNQNQKEESLADVSLHSNLDSSINTSNNDNDNDNDFQRKHAKLLEHHPMKINLIFRYRHYQLTCSFKFFPKLELIALDYNIENLMPSTGTRPDFQVTSYENNIFSKLLSSSDTGFKCPNAIIEHLLRRYGIETYSHLIHHTGYTFDWAQRISGIEYLNPDEKPLLSNRGIIRVKSSIASDCLDKTIKLMMLRFQSRINLQEQLEEISQKRSVDLDRFQCLLDSKLVADKQNLMDKTKPRSMIDSFEKISTEQLIEEVNERIKHSLIDYFERHDGQHFSNDLFDHNNFLFKMIVRCQTDNHKQQPTPTRCMDGNHLHVYIIIPHNYPWRWPFFIISKPETNKTSSSAAFFLEHKWLRSLEEHINVNLPLKVMQQSRMIDETLYSETLLLRQVYDLQCGLDVCLDARHKYERKNNVDDDANVQVYSGPRCVNSFVSTAIVQGHDHSLKFAS